MAATGERFVEGFFLAGGMARLLGAKPAVPAKVE
jgi:hypothetical protein